jgi:transcriptional regulator with XRE-family HTH domain
MYFRERMTQEDIAERIGVCQQRAFQLIEQALDRLRRPDIMERLESAIPAGRKPPVSGHTALHAYQVAQAYGESWEDRDFLREQDREICRDNKERADFRDSYDAPEFGGMENWEEYCFPGDYDQYRWDRR